MNWPHSPPHWLFTPGLYIVTVGTYQKAHHLSDPTRLNYFSNLLIQLADDFAWELKAWAILSNHYHFVAQSPANPRTLSKLLGKLHGLSAIHLNRLDNTPGRKVWFQSWDTHLTFENSYLARLQYVNQNAVHHGVAAAAEQYPWCSAGWFGQSATPAFRQTVESFKTDQVTVPDDF